MDENENQQGVNEEESGGVVDITRVGENVISLKASPELDAYTRVVLTCGQSQDGKDLVYIWPDNAGDDGRDLNVYNPWGSLQMAKDIWNQVSESGGPYRPYWGTDAYVEPAAELGDGIYIGEVYSGIYNQDINFSALMASDVSAPTVDEKEHEFEYIPQIKRELLRASAYSRSKITQTNQKIALEVEERVSETNRLSAELEETAGYIRAETVMRNNKTSSVFGWEIHPDTEQEEGVFRVYTNSGDVLRITKTGLYVKGDGEFSGKITATSGSIGGITIKNNSIESSNGNFQVTSLGEVTAKNLKISGGSITIGDNFKVSSTGNVTANSMKLTGTLTVGDSTISANNLRLGAERCNSGYGSWNNTTTGFNGGLTGNSNRPGNWTVDTLQASSAYISSLHASNYFVPNSSSPSYDLSSHHHSIYESGGKMYISEPGASSSGFSITATKTYKDGVAAAKSQGASGVSVNSISVYSSPTTIMPDRVRVVVSLTNGKSATMYGTPE